MSPDQSHPVPTVPTMSYTTRDPSPAGPQIEVRSSKRRKKTAGAHWEGDRIVVVVPTHLRGSERDRMVESLARRLTRHRPNLHTSDAHLEERARALGRRHLDGVEPASIRWSTTQNKRWGSCTIETREVRISERLRVAPPWVLDAVIVHELAHLIEPNHSARFKELESRYPRRREADVFLEGYSLGLHMPAVQPCDPASGEGFDGDADGAPVEDAVPV